MQTTYDKIYKYANTEGILDVTAILNHYVKKQNEEIYRGKIVFSLWDQENNQYARAFLDKTSAKLLFHTIMNQKFDEIYGMNGFRESGGTVSDETVTSRLLEIHALPGELYSIVIAEGEGIIDEKIGSIKMKAEPERILQIRVPKLDMIKLSIETYDYIRDVESVSLQRGKSLHTKTTYYQAEEKEKEGKKLIEYKIPYGILKGKRMDELSDRQLEMIIQQKAADTLSREMAEQAQIERDRRNA